MNARSTSAAMLAACAVTGATAASASAAPSPQRGTPVSAVNVAHLTARQTIEAIHQWTEEKTLRLDTSTVRTGIRAYRLTYRTVGVDGTTPTTASGLVVIPADAGPATRVVAWEHGTTIDRHDAPSTGKDADARLTAYLFAGSGSIVVAPDYLGLGTGQGAHPFNHRPSEVAASIDMLRAARVFVTGRSLTFNPRVQVAGFSQGGKVAVAVAGALQGGSDPSLQLGALAGIAGPYDLQHAQTPRQSTLDPYGVSFYLAYTALAWDPIFGIYDRPSQVFRPPYDKTLPKLFDGKHSQAAVFAGLNTPDTVFTKAFLDHVAHPTGGLLKGEQTSDGACRWSPQAPARLYAASTDEQVAFLNTTHCQRDFNAAGADVPVIDLGKHSHFGSAILATNQVLRWFARLATQP